MKYIRSYIFFVIAIMLVLLLFTACIQITPQPADDTTDDSFSPSQETTQEGRTSQDKETTNITETEIEPIATDSPQVSLPPSPQQTTYTPEAGVVELFLGEPVLVDLDGAGVMTEIEIIDADGALVLLSTQGGFEHHLYIANIPAGYLTNAYFVKSFDGYPFVVVSYDYCSDDYETSVLTFSGFEPSGNFKLPIAVHKINENKFSTYGYICNRHMGCQHLSVFCS